MYRLKLTTLVLLCILQLLAQERQLGTVVDYHTQKPIAGVEVRFECDSVQTVKTNEDGNFSIYLPEQDATVGVNTTRPQQCISVTISEYSLNGLYIGQRQVNSCSMDNLTGTFIQNGRICHVLHQQIENHKQLTTRLKSKQSCTGLTLSKKGYTEAYPLLNDHNLYELSDTSYDDLIYSQELKHKETFDLFSSDPLIHDWGESQSIKFIYDFRKDSIYYINTNHYKYHVYFAQDILGYIGNEYTFSKEQYSYNPDRTYYLGSITYHSNIESYTIDFFPGDSITCEGLDSVYTKMTETAYWTDQLYLLAINTDWEHCSTPSLSQNDLIGSKNYFAMNIAESYGYLKVHHDNSNIQQVNRYDIVVLNELPNDISIVSGMITSQFQTPLCHLNVLSHNRNTPNMVLRDVLSNRMLDTLENELIYLNVLSDTFHIRKATIKEAEAFWIENEPQITQYLALDIETEGLVNLDTVDHSYTSTIGGKASNFAELLNVKSGIPTPEDYFAIPFYYYWQHIHNNGINELIQATLSNEEFKTNSIIKETALKQIRDSILLSPLDEELLELVNEHLKRSAFNTFRFRSSTNAEDIEGFNGAGLYSSYSAEYGSVKEPVEFAIKRVWASLWNFRAYEERCYFKIDHSTIAMGILVHRSFPDEDANGVVVTENLFGNYPAYTINVQHEGISVVIPDETTIPDILLLYKLPGYEDLHNSIEYICRSNLEEYGTDPVLSDDEIQQLGKHIKEIHKHYLSLGYRDALDVEFKLDSSTEERKIYIKQVRPY